MAGLEGAVTRISERGRVTIPKPLRERFGLHPDAEVEFTPAGDGLLIRTCANGGGDGGETEEALLLGWLKEVDWDGRTARLHDAGGGRVRLRFGPALDRAMRRLATEYVEVHGRGRLDERDEWIEVRVEELRETRSWREPFDLDAFLADPEAKVFDPEQVVTVSEPFDVEEFMKGIYEARGE